MMAYTVITEVAVLHFNKVTKDTNHEFQNVP